MHKELSINWMFLKFNMQSLLNISYVGLMSIICSRKLKELFKKYFCIDIRVVFTPFKVKNYFSLKCSTSLPFLTNVVYKFKCLRNATHIYIGKTMRHLATRVREPGTSSLAVLNNLSSCQTYRSHFSYNSFLMIDSDKCDYEITVKEALHIKFEKTFN